MAVIKKYYKRKTVPPTEPRQEKQIRAFEAEWQLIKKFQQLIRTPTGLFHCRNIVNNLETTLGVSRSITHD